MYAHYFPSRPEPDWNDSEAYMKALAEVEFMEEREVYIRAKAIVQALG